jgi:hypothetical protein
LATHKKVSILKGKKVQGSDGKIAESIGKNETEILQHFIIIANFILLSDT